MIGICGDDCRFCPRYAATKDGNSERLREVRDFWVKLGLREPDFPARQMACHGCGPENRCAYPEVRACANQKGVAHCGLCREYPCGSILAAFDKSEQMRSRCDPICTTEERAILKKAFFAKRQNLDGFSPRRAH
ncbi:MAG: DUF3795 domain-containing protein [Elusimicrobiota bacterium]